MAITSPGDDGIRELGPAKPLPHERSGQVMRTLSSAMMLPMTTRIQFPLVRYFLVPQKQMLIPQPGHF